MKKIVEAIRQTDPTEIRHERIMHPVLGKTLKTGIVAVFSDPRAAGLAFDSINRAIARAGTKSIRAIRPTTIGSRTAFPGASEIKSTEVSVIGETPTGHKTIQKLAQLLQKPQKRDPRKYDASMRAINRALSRR